MILFLLVLVYLGIGTFRLIDFLSACFSSASLVILVNFDVLGGATYIQIGRGSTTRLYRSIFFLCSATLIIHVLFVYFSERNWTFFLRTRSLQFVLLRFRVFFFLPLSLPSETNLFLRWRQLRRRRRYIQLINLLGSRFSGSGPVNESDPVWPAVRSTLSFEDSKIYICLSAHFFVRFLFWGFFFWFWGCFRFRTTFFDCSLHIVCLFEYWLSGYISFCD